jgi:cell shape-determining protein MreD
MNKLYFKNIIRFVLLILFQVLVLNQVSLNGYIIPYSYLLFILLLPFDIPGSILLLLAFVTGFSIDFFGNTLGLHTAAMLLLAFARPGVLKLYFKKLETLTGEEPGIQKLGVRGFIKYAFSLILIHHLFLFFLERFSVSHLFTTIEHALINSVASMLLILIILMLFTNRKRKKRF